MNKHLTTAIVGCLMLSTGTIPIYANPEPVPAPVHELRPRRLPPMTARRELVLA